MAERLTRTRRAALEVLRRVRRGELADRALADAGAGLPPHDRAWLHELVYGTLRLRGRLDAWLRPRVRAGLAALDDDVLDVLRLGAYQLLEMHSVPPYAAVSQSVELARAAGAGRAAGLVNAVLQALNRAGPPQPPAEASVDALADWGSHPRWLVERWVERFGAEPTARLLEADNTRPELYVRPLGVPLAAAAARLADAGIVAEPVARFPDVLRVLPPAGAAEALARVPAVVQDPAAASAARFAAVPDGAVALDLCAAPGGKTMVIAERARYTVAADRSAPRLARVREHVQRLEAARRVGLVVADARHPPFAPADFVIVDAPCTGTGTFRRHPDGRWRITPDDLRALAALQQEILDAAAACVRPGGVLVYATCSLEPEENEARVEAFLARHTEFRLDPAPGVVDPSLVRGECLYVLPHETGVDGAFAARMRRQR